MFCFWKGGCTVGQDEVPPKVWVEGTFKLVLDERMVPTIRQRTLRKKLWVCLQSKKIALVMAVWRWTTPSSDENPGTSKLALQDVFGYLPVLKRAPACPVQGLLLCQLFAGFKP